jgi:hypothetical protein
VRGIVLLLATLIGLPAGAAGSRAFDHAAFDALLRAHVRDGRVDYDAFKAAPSFRAYLDALDRADAAAPGEDERERLAYWINVYNAYTIELIVRHGERESIRNINKTLGLVAGKGPWKEPLVRAGGRRLSLDDVEHEIIRKQFREPRIHFALVCAAVSCPPLRGEAYTGARLDAQLDEQTRLFLLRTPASNRVDVAARKVHVSPIFDWYRQDFGGSDAAIGRFVAQYYAAGPERDLLLGGAFKLETTPYDWSLNGAARGGAAK